MITLLAHHYFVFEVRRSAASQTHDCTYPLSSLDDDDEEIDVVEVQPNAKRARLVNGHHAGENSAAGLITNSTLILFALFWVRR